MTATETEIRYMHIRRRSIKYEGGALYSNTPASIGGITVAYRKIGTDRYKCAFTRCNVKEGDHYCKAAGRIKARRRLLEDDDVWMLSTEEGTSPTKAIVELITQLKEYRRALRPEVR